MDRTTPVTVFDGHNDAIQKLHPFADEELDRVGFGSDFDGATMPNAIADVAGLPRLIDALRAHGMDEESIQKLARRNWLRVLRITWGH